LSSSDAAGGVTVNTGGAGVLQRMFRDGRDIEWEAQRSAAAIRGVSGRATPTARVTPTARASPAMSSRSGMLSPPATLTAEALEEHPQVVRLVTKIRKRLEKEWSAHVLSLQQALGAAEANAQASRHTAERVASECAQWRGRAVALEHDAADLRRDNAALRSEVQRLRSAALSTSAVHHKVRRRARCSCHAHRLL
jgi:hypothetical protein